MVNRRRSVSSGGRAEGVLNRGGSERDQGRNGLCSKLSPGAFVVAAFWLFFRGVSLSKPACVGVFCMGDKKAPLAASHIVQICRSGGRKGKQAWWEYTEASLLVETGVQLSTLSDNELLRLNLRISADTRTLWSLAFVSLTWVLPIRTATECRRLILTITRDDALRHPKYSCAESPFFRSESLVLLRTLVARP